MSGPVGIHLDIPKSHEFSLSHLDWVKLSFVDSVNLGRHDPVNFSQHPGKLASPARTADAGGISCDAGVVLVMLAMLWVLDATTCR